MTPEELEEIQERHSYLLKGGPIDMGMAIELARGILDVRKLLAHIKDLESQIPRWIPITLAVPDENEIVLFKMVELIALKGEEKPMRGSDPIPDFGEVFPDKIERRTSYFTGYRTGNVYRDHTHNCVRKYVRLEWVRIFKEEEE